MACSFIFKNDCLIDPAFTQQLHAQFKFLYSLGLSPVFDLNNLLK